MRGRSASIVSVKMMVYCPSPHIYCIDYELVTSVV